MRTLTLGILLMSLPVIAKNQNETPVYDHTGTMGFVNPTPDVTVETDEGPLVSCLGGDTVVCTQGATAAFTITLEDGSDQIIWLESSGPDPLSELETTQDNLWWKQQDAYTKQVGQYIAAHPEDKGNVKVFAAVQANAPKFPEASFKYRIVDDYKTWHGVEKVFCVPTFDKHGKPVTKRGKEACYAYR